MARELLVAAGYSNPDSVIDRARRYKVPIFEKALFARECWAGVLDPNDTAWLDSAIAEFESRQGRKDLYALKCLPEKPELLAALKEVKGGAPSIAALTLLIREAQLSVLGNITRLLDGGSCFHDGLEDNWVLAARDDKGNPGKGFGSVAEMVWDFDPSRPRG
jgi:hypothetical protein